MAGLDDQQAPEFALTNQHGQLITLASLAGRRAVLMFFPFAFSSVCSRELADVREQIGRFDELDAAVVGISCDPMYTLRVFSDQTRVAFSLLSDFWPHGKVAVGYGAFDAQRGCATRTSFVLDRAGVVRSTVRNQMPQARPLDRYFDALAAMD